MEMVVIRLCLCKVMGNLDVQISKLWKSRISQSLLLSNL